MLYVFERGKIAFSQNARHMKFSTHSTPPSTQSHISNPTILKLYIARWLAALTYMEFIICVVFISVCCPKRRGREKKIFYFCHPLTNTHAHRINLSHTTHTHNMWRRFHPFVEYLQMIMHCAYSVDVKSSRSWCSSARCGNSILKTNK